MIAHILMPKLDKDAPASFSSVIIHDLLREELGYEGVVISDDMTMGAITEHYDMAQAAVKFIQAGGNIVLVGHGEDNIQNVVKALTEAVEQGDISMDVLDERVTQILKLKEKYKLDDTAQAEGPDVKALNQRIAELMNQF
ncbi:putative lipoprotein YbbD precursor [compost metagenome]